MYLINDMNTKIEVKLLTFLIHTPLLFRGQTDINTQAFKKIKIFRSDLNNSYQSNRNDEMRRQSRTVFRFFWSDFKCFEWKSIAAICWKKWRKAVLVVTCSQLRVKNDYILPLNKYRHHKTNISLNWHDIAKSRKLFTKRIKNGFSIPIDYFPYCP